MTQHPKLKLIFLGLPPLVLLAWVLSLEWQLSRAQRVELSIRGYDPRDLLSGHYINYRLDLGDFNPCSATKVETVREGDNACLCWQPTLEAPELTWGGLCTERPAGCSLYLQGQCRNNTFEAGVERTYIPEGDSPYLQQLPPHSRVILKLTPDGRAFVEELKPEGRPYREWIDAQKQKRQ